MTATGAGVVILAWIVGLVARGFGVGSLALLGAIAVLAVLYLEHAPDQKINWPIAPSLIVLGISAIVAIAALLTLVDWLGYTSLLGVSGILSLLLYAVGGGIMLWGAWQEYQVEKPAMPNFNATSTSSSAPAAPAAPAAAPSAPPAAPPVSTGYDDRDEAPPA
jgi:predicted lysophospholipase L1 biosynthesis ABC-type transport system permease subunit